MFHVQIKLGDDEEDIELIVQQLNYALSRLQIRSIRHYSSSRVGSRIWYVIFRNVRADNWEPMRATVDKVLRNHDCAYTMKPPTVRATTRMSRA